MLLSSSPSASPPEALSQSSETITPAVDWVYTAVSTPPPPLRVSAPAPPCRLSLPHPPDRALAPLLPVRKSLNQEPVMFSMPTSVSPSAVPPNPYPIHGFTYARLTITPSGESP